MSTFFKTIVVSNGNFLYSDKRLVIRVKEKGQDVIWDGARTLENLSRPGLFLTDEKEEKQKIGKVVSFHELGHGSAEKMLNGVFRHVFDFKKQKIKTIQEIVFYLGGFNLGFFKKQRCFIGITEKGHTFEVTTGVGKIPVKIQIFDPGVLRIYVSANNPWQIERFNEIFENQKVDEEFTKNAFLAISATNRGSVNYDKMSKTGVFLANIKPTIEEEKEAHGVFYHPRYKENRPARRLWNS